FLLGGLATERMLVAMTWVRKHARAIQITGGLFLLVIGLLLVTDRWNSLLSPLRRWINNVVLPI
ncbi:MAG TPA: cytochrome c biogenesis protein CcdA, partial [Actinomycetota bacterium]|nr:cytochrome c biogenesis protein CcdA [Actinomycetota bacterium]